MSSGPGLHHVTVRTVDFEGSIRFYREALGFGTPYRWSFPGVVDRAAFLDSGNGTWVEIFADGSPDRHDEPTEGLVHFALLYDDVDAAFERALAAGAAPLMEPGSFTLQGDPPVEVRLAYVQGPSGERIELYRTELTPRDAAASQ
jgi:catechol 2,3-dioxygenase-like lactoylglutathione lyase family enzyme